jgi:hypothetical protein
MYEPSLTRQRRDAAPAYLTLNRRSTENGFKTLLDFTHDTILKFKMVLSRFV